MRLWLLFRFHFECVGVTHNDECVKSEDIPYFCPKCSGNPSKFNYPAKSGRKPPANKKSKKKEPVTPKPVKEPVTPKAGKESARKAAKSVARDEPVQQVEPLVKSPSIKLKISFGKQEQQQQQQQQQQKEQLLLQALQPQVPRTSGGVLSSPVTSSSAENSRRKRKDSEEEEEKWLDAVESGNLHVVDDELKRIRDPKLMTARQRAMITKKIDLNQTPPGTVMSSPSPAIQTELFSNTSVNLVRI